MIRAIAALVLALAAQYLFVSIDVGAQLRTLFASIAEALVSEPPEPPRSTPVAKNEREINRQQQESAERLAALVDSVDAPAPQPDEVRATSSGSLIDEDLAMRCGERLPPESVWTTRDVSIHVASRYQGEHRGQHTWKYEVSFRNNGVDTVQMLSRHWVFTDSDGKSHEMKGPGARGVTPILGPGDSWAYESGATLTTPIGAMHGGFQFETLKANNRQPSAFKATGSPEPPPSFHARVARLALSSENRGENVPCAVEDDDESTLPTTSVRSTRRVIVGASAHAMPQMSKPEEGRYAFAYDVQINNAREGGLRVIGHKWTLQTATTKFIASEGDGVGGRMGGRAMALPAGEAFRVQGLLTADAPLANANGHYLVEDDGSSERFEVEVGAIGLSEEEGGRVPRYG